MKFEDAFSTAVFALRTNVMRSILTTLGIVIGVGSVVVMISVGAGAEKNVTSFIRSLGSNIIMITPGATRMRGVSAGAGSQPTLTWRDADAIEENVGSLEVVAPSQDGAAQLVSQSNNWQARVSGVTPGSFIAHDWTIRLGETFTNADVRGATKVAVIGETIVETLFPNQNPVGASFRINRIPFKVVGVLDEKGQSTFGQDQDDIVFIPLSTAKKRLFGKGALAGDSVTSITVKVKNAELMLEAETEITELLRTRHKLRDAEDNDFRIHNFEQILQTSADTTRILTLLLAAIASISLLVGGIGIMNIMLVSVAERTKEIGLRLAVGAAETDIRLQFLIEAAVLSMVGGVIGILLGAGGASAIASVAGWPTVLSPSSIVLAFGFSAFVGIFFGYYPAHRASKLDPIVALRRE